MKEKVRWEEREIGERRKQERNKRLVLLEVGKRGGQWRTEGWGGLRCSNPPPRNSEGPPKSCQTQPDCENC